MAKKKHRRATALVVRDSRVLLALHRGQTHYPLPGGHIDGRETSLEAAVREVREETQLRAYSAQRLTHCDIEGSRSKHFVSEVKVGNEKVRLQGKEIRKHLWWNGKSKIPANGHVHSITKSSGVFDKN